MPRVLDRHAVQALRRAKVTAHAIATQFGVSIRTVRCLLREEAVDTRDDVAALAPRSSRSLNRKTVMQSAREPSG